MIIIPINRELNCERMLESGKLQTEHWHAEECLWLIKYLRKKKFPENEVFEKWKYFWKQHKIEYDDDDFERNFKSFSGNAATVVFKGYYPKIIVYQDEIDYINSLPAPLWIRQYIYILMLHSKATGNDTYDYLPYDDYHWWLSLKGTNSSEIRGRLAGKLKEFGIIKIIKIKETHEWLPEIDEYGNPIGFEHEVTIENDRLRIELPVKIINEENKVVYKTILDALDDIGKIHSLYKCGQCGKTFEFSLRTQRTICSDCYKEARKKVKRDYWNKTHSNNNKEH